MAGTVGGETDTRTWPTAAAPIIIFTVALAALEPENAFTSAVPEIVPASSFTVALPSLVLASAGSTAPREVVKVTEVPFCTGYPLDSMTLAVMSVDPFTGRNCEFV